MKDNYKRLDAGVSFSVGYKLIKGIGMNFGIRYYTGLTNIYKSGHKEYNSNLYIYAEIPIGAKKAEEKRENNN